MVICNSGKKKKGNQFNNKRKTLILVDGMGISVAIVASTRDDRVRDEASVYDEKVNHLNKSEAEQERKIE